MGKILAKKNNGRGQETDNNVIQGLNHIIFKRQIPKFRIDIPIVNEYSLYLSEFSEKMPEFASILNELRNANPDDIIKIFINSPGGCVSEGKAIINTLQSIGANIQTELIAHAYSMGALLFCIGDRRVIYENSSIMFHNYSAGISGKGHEIEQRVIHLSENLESFFKSILIGLTDEEIDSLIDGKDFWFSAKEMCQRGIATHVVIDGITVTSEEYLKALKQAKKRAKKQGLKISTLHEAYLQGIDEIEPLAAARENELQTISTQISAIVNDHEFLYN